MLLTICCSGILNKLYGVSWIHGLGYQPHVALYEDPLMLKNKMKEKYDVQFSQIDAAFPLSGKDGPTYGTPYVLKAIPWAKHAGCQCIAITDGLHKPEVMSDEKAMDMMKEQFEQILEVAEAYKMQMNIEVHGYYTTNPDMLEKMLNFCDSEYLGLNMDTGNTFIAGRGPVEFLKRFIDKVRYVHIKDVSESLAAAFTGFKYRNAEDPSSGVIPLSEGKRNTVAGLKKLALLAGRYGVNIYLEHLNSKISNDNNRGHPGYLSN